MRVHDILKKKIRNYVIDANDTPRYIVRTVQTMLRSLNLPASKDTMWMSRITFYIVIINMVIMQIAHVTYMILHITDVTKMADTCATVSTTFQGIVKLISMYIHSKNIRKMFRIIYESFWSTTIAENKYGLQLNRLANWCQMLMFCFYILIFFCCSLLLIPPLFLGVRELPLASIYPFDWQISPIYEIMYVWQWIINLYGVCFVVGTHDFLFVAMMVQLIVQFRLLQYVLKKIGTKQEGSIMRIFKEHNIGKKQHYEGDDALLIQSVIHHIEMLKFADIIEETFSAIVFSQFLESVSGLCLGVFLLNLVDGVNFIKLVFFIIVHLAQLLLYCLFGNEVMYQSGLVAHAAFDANWHEIYNRPNIKPGFVLIIQRAQRSKKITALGMADLNMTSFIEVLRSSISFSTLLKTVIEKQRKQ